MLQFGTLPAELTRRSMERFAQGVMPRLQRLEPGLSPDLATAPA
jgi:hypothetical protein